MMVGVAIPYELFTNILEALNQAEVSLVCDDINGKVYHLYS